MTTEKLVSLIEFHNRKYWDDAAPEISDEEYDSLLRELASRDPRHPLLEKVLSPKITGASTVRHASPMLSLDKAYSHGELLEWAAKFARDENEPFLAQPKYDGISASLADGVLATRGDGFEGEDISDKLPLINLEKATYKGPPAGDARGEIVIRNDDFKNLYPNILKKDGKPYKNQRNAVAGIVGLKDISGMILQGARLTLVDYGTHTETISLAELKDKSRWSQIIEKFSALPYPMDGIVLKLKDSAYSDSLGSTAHHPRGQIAFKFSGTRAVSTIKHIEWSFGKKFLTPLAVIEPVEIGGTTIKKLTLHNYRFLKTNDIQIGDKIVVERAGDVIPHIVSCEAGPDRRPADIGNCPSCATKLLVEGPELMCPNPECPELKIQRLLAAVRNIGIERLGEPTIRKMSETLGVKCLKDIFSLSKEQIATLEGFKSKSSENLYNEIQAARSTCDFELLASLNIQGIGKNIAKSMLQKFTLDELRRMDADKLEQIPGIGPERAKELFERLKDKSDSIDELTAALDLVQSKGAGGQPKRTICFTGKMPQPRSHYEKLAEANGWTPADSVTESLHLLVAADSSGNSSKLQKASKLGIKTLTLDEWMKTLGATQEPRSTARTKDNTDSLLPGF